MINKNQMKIVGKSDNGVLFVKEGSKWVTFWQMFFIIDKSY